MATPKISPVRIATISDTIYEYLLESIISGKIPPGTPLTMQGLAEQFDVSLMPVRDALKKLEAVNVIERGKNRRVVVRHLSIGDFDELLEIRMHLEILAARKAARNATEQSLRELKRIAAETEKTRTMIAFVEKNAQFHQTIYHAAQSPILQDIINGLWLRLRPYLHIYASGRTEHKTADKLHAGILDGMLKRDEKKVSDFLRRDLEHGAAAVITVLKKRPEVIQAES
jgi:DNA-binding GntR family transcriptional regulator